VQQTNSWLAPFSVSSVDFISIDTAGVRGPRKADGSLPDVSFMHLAQGSKLIDAGTDVGLPCVGGAPDLGAFEYGTATTVSERALSSPQRFDLFQNYPNPFNPTTDIVYSVPKQSRVKLEVFNILGQKVATLVDETKIAGQYSVSFGASNLSSGAYIYWLSSETQTISKKMVLMK